MSVPPGVIPPTAAASGPAADAAGPAAAAAGPAAAAAGPATAAAAPAAAGPAAAAAAGPAAAAAAGPATAAAAGPATAAAGTPAPATVAPTPGGKKRTENDEPGEEADESKKKKAKQEEPKKERKSDADDKNQSGSPLMDAKTIQNAVEIGDMVEKATGMKRINDGAAELAGKAWDKTIGAVGEKVGGLMGKMGDKIEEKLKIGESSSQRPKPTLKNDGLNRTDSGPPAEPERPNPGDTPRVGG